MKTAELFKEVETKLNRVRTELNDLDALKDETLYYRPGAKKWSAIECIEHLNNSYRFYIPKMEQEIFKYNGPANDNFKPGFLLKYMIRNLYPHNGKRRMKVKTFKSMKPQISRKKRNLIIEEYRDFLNRMETIADKSQQVDMNRIRIVSAVGPILRIKLGDCFPFLLNHDLRHLLQAREAVAFSGQAVPG